MLQIEIFVAKYLLRILIANNLRINFFLFLSLCAELVVRHEPALEVTKN